MTDTKEPEKIRIGIDLNETASKKFLIVKNNLGIESNADVVRWLINWYWEKVFGNQEIQGH